MKFSAIVHLLPLSLAFTMFCRVHAGFCDGKSGHYCRTKSSGSYSTYCVCKYKTKNGKTERDCDNKGETFCTNGCSVGYCLSAHKVCASAPLSDVGYDDGTKSYSLSQSCPAVTQTTYLTWKDVQTSNLHLLARTCLILSTHSILRMFTLKFIVAITICLIGASTKQANLKKMVEVNKEWSKESMLSKFYSSSAKNATRKNVTLGKVAQAWDQNCKSEDVKQMNCRVFFPKCVGNKGYNTECITYCNKAIECINQVQSACQSANPDDPSACTKFSDWGPEQGNTDCNRLCDRNQNDHVFSAASINAAGSFAAVAVALILTFM